MNCVDVQEAMSPYLDGELERVDLQRLEEHLIACGTCRIEIDGVRHVDGMLAALPRSTGGVESPGDHRPEAPFPRRWMSRRPPGWVMAAGLLLAFGVVWVARPPGVAAPPARATVRLANSAYQVHVEGGTLLSIEMYDSQSGSVRVNGVGGGR